MDLLLESRWGPIPRQWAEEGETVFRRREADLLEELAAGGGAKVVSTGGGVVLSPTSVETMRTSGTVVWLRADPSTLRTRLTGGSERPPLAGRNLEALSEERKSLYESSADRVVDTDALTVTEVVEEVIAAWK
jgi:shikimate kinase